jgi:hypothetical protein
MAKQITIKTTEKAQRLLRLIAASTGEKQYEVLERLLDAELKGIQNSAHKRGKSRDS